MCCFSALPVLRVRQAQNVQLKTTRLPKRYNQDRSVEALNRRHGDARTSTAVASALRRTSSQDVLGHALKTNLLQHSHLLSMWIHVHEQINTPGGRVYRNRSNRVPEHRAHAPFVPEDFEPANKSVVSCDNSFGGCNRSHRADKDRTKVARSGPLSSSCTVMLL
jgi:hypothetical protein